MSTVTPLSRERDRTDIAAVRPGAGGHRSRWAPAEYDDPDAEASA
ncbi:hypothetical protein [Streptosporangium sp. NPDC049046]